MTLSDFHMHTRFCDGMDEPEAMVDAALKLGMKRMGFSGHAHTPFDPEACMSVEATGAYKREIRRLKTKYAGRIEIYLGAEQDYFSDLPTGDYDYVIGSVHYLQVNGGVRCADMSAESLRAAIDECFGGDPYSLAEAYYRLAADVVRKTGARIIGHFDLITKFNERGEFFDEEHPRYAAASGTAVDALVRTGRPFEINTGAISRGYRSAPYPSMRLMRRIAERGGSAVLSSDSHSAESLCFMFEECRAMAAAAGLKIIDFRP